MRLPQTDFEPRDVTAGEPDFSTPEGRRIALFSLAASRFREWFDREGCWVSDSTPPDTRETVWGMFSLLQGGREEVKLANTILGRLELKPHHPSRSPEEAGSDFDIFITNHTVQMLVRYGPLLVADVRQKLEGWARHALRDYPGDRQCDYQFHGMNDNMPSKATLGLILGGEYFGDPDAVAHGLWNLRQLRDLLTRRGLLSEYTSPTYLPLSIINLTEVALYARDEEARRLAGQCVERMWADVLGHFHPPTGTMGGPYSRAYQLDSVGHLSTMACLLWITLGKRTAIDVYRELARPSIRLLHHHDSRASQVGLASWVSACRLVPPDYLLGWLERRRYPFRLNASAERGFEGGGEVNTSFYAEEDFALGCASDDAWSELQTEMFFLQYRRHQPLRGVEDLRTAYCRYLVNRQCPGDRKSDHLLKPYGIVHTVHGGRTALVLARPSLDLSGMDVDTLKFSLILPVHFGRVEKIEVRDGLVLIRDGPLYLGLRGLNPTDWGRKDAVRIETVKNYCVISFFNYEGAARRFESDELGRTLNGFAAVTGLKSEEGWDAFCGRVEAAEVLDYFHFGTRTTRCRIDGTVLGMSYALKSDRVRFRTANGRLVPRPEWEADGMPAGRLPFLAGPRPNTLELPYKHLRAVWAPDQDGQWVIASTGNAGSPDT